MPHTCEAFNALIPTIVTRWMSSVDCPPWSLLSEADRLDHLPEYLHDLFECAVCQPSDSVLRRNFIEVAASHGDQRVKVGFEAQHVMEESALLRQHLWTTLWETHRSAAELLEIDNAL